MHIVVVYTTRNNSRKHTTHAFNSYKSTLLQMILLVLTTVITISNGRPYVPYQTTLSFRRVLRSNFQIVLLTRKFQLTKSFNYNAKAKLIAPILPLIVGERSIAYNCIYVVKLICKSWMRVLCVYVSCLWLFVTICLIGGVLNLVDALLNTDSFCCVLCDVGLVGATMGGTMCGVATRLVV